MIFGVPSPNRAALGSCSDTVLLDFQRVAWQGISPTRFSKVQDWVLIRQFHKGQASRRGPIPIFPSPSPIIPALGSRTDTDSLEPRIPRSNFFDFSLLPCSLATLDGHPRIPPVCGPNPPPRVFWSLCGGRGGPPQDSQHPIPVHKFPFPRLFPRLWW